MAWCTGSYLSATALDEARQILEREAGDEELGRPVIPWCIRCARDPGRCQCREPVMAWQPEED